MIIQSLLMSNGGLQSVDNNKTAKTTLSKTSKSDTVEISQSAKNRESDVVAQELLAVEFPPREEKIDEARRMMADGSYNQQDYLEKLAEEMINSPALTDTVSSISSDRTDSKAIRTASVTKAYDQVRQNYYDNKAVMEEIAGRLIDALGFSGQF